VKILVRGFYKDLLFVIGRVFRIGGHVLVFKRHGEDGKGDNIGAGTKSFAMWKKRQVIIESAIS